MTALKTIPKATVNGAIKLARLPADTVLRAAPESVASPAGRAVDRADAAVRSAAGTALRDPQLRDEAKHLRERASEHAEAGETRAEKTRAEAEKRRKLADQRAKRNRARARQRRQQKQAEARKAEDQRKQAAQKRAAEQQDKVKAGRIDALETKADALKEREPTLTETGEAQRLKDAAGRARQERKEATERTPGPGSRVGW